MPQQILACAEDLAADLIVMGTHGRAGFERLLVGSIAEKVLRSARCPVMICATASPRSGVAFGRCMSGRSCVQLISMTPR